VAVSSEQDTVVGFPLGFVDRNQDYFINNHVSFEIVLGEEVKAKDGNKAFRIVQVKTNPSR
jgi:Endomembrane protein 70